MRIVVAFLLLSLVACGQIQEKLPHRKVLRLNQFKDYVTAFTADARVHGVDLKIRDLVIEFEETEDRDDGLITLGRCYMAPARTPRVIIDPMHWENLSDTSKKLLIYHELGHCVLQRDHEEKVESIMNPHLISDFEYEADEEGFLAELFYPEKRNTLWKLFLLVNEEGDMCGGAHADTYRSHNLNSTGYTVHRIHVR